MKKGTITDLQYNEDYIILNNPLASPKFIRMIGKGKEIAISDVYTPKIFYEIASKLTPEHLVNIQRNQSVVLEIQIKDFLGSIGANKKNYKHFIESVEVMQSNLLRWKEGDDIITTAIVSKSIHNPKTGKVEMFIDSDIAKRILEIKEDGNFSFLKSNVFRLQNAQAIKLYPFFKSWLNYGHYSTDLERFKTQFGYNTSGYKYWSNLEIKVLTPAVEEINEKTDIQVSYEALGENLDGKRPKVRGVKFSIYKKDDIKILSEASPNAGEPHIDTTIQPGLFDKDKQVNNLYDLLQRITIQEKPTMLTAKTLILSLINNIGYQAVKDGFLGMIDSKAKPKTIAFFTVDNLLKYPGFEQAHNIIQDKKRQEKEKEQEKINKQRTIDEIKNIYSKQRSEYLKKVFAEMEVEAKSKEIHDLWESSTLKMVYFKNNDKQQPNTYAIEKIAQKIAFPGGYDEQKHLKHFALKNWNIQIDFDEKGEITIN